MHLLDAGQLNTYDVLVNDDVVFSRGGLDAFLARTGHKELPDLSTDGHSRGAGPVESRTGRRARAPCDTEDDEK